jgi:NADPH2:quinone reductase
VLRLESIPAPTPGWDDVLVQVEAVGVNFVEIYQRTGLYPVTLPFAPGTEGAGTVVAVGAGVTTVHPGDRVASESLRGSYAELAVAPASRVVPLPDGMDAATGAAAMIQALTAHYLTTSTFPLAAGDWCLVHAAAGGTGLLLCQMARIRGARVIGTVSTETKAALAHEAGAEVVVRYTEQDVVAEVRRVTGGGVRVAYDSVGRTTWEASVDALGPRGMLVLFGQSSGAVPPIDPLVLMRKGSLFLTRPTVSHYVSKPEELQARAKEIFQWIGDGRLRLRIDRRFPLGEAAEAHRALEGRGTSGKLLLVP